VCTLAWRVHFQVMQVTVIQMITFMDEYSSYWMYESLQESIFKLYNWPWFKLLCLCKRMQVITFMSLRKSAFSSNTRYCDSNHYVRGRKFKLLHLWTRKSITRKLVCLFIGMIVIVDLETQVTVVRIVSSQCSFQYSSSWLIAAFAVPFDGPRVLYSYYLFW